MKIALFLDSFPKISETFILTQVEGLLTRGHEVTIFPRVASGEVLLHPIVKSWHLLDKTHFPPVNVRTLASRLGFRLRLGVASLVYRRSVARLKKTFDAHRYLPGWRGALAEAVPVIRHGGRFDILFAHFGPNGLRANWYRETGLIQGALVTVFHGYDLTEYLRTRSDAVYGPLFRNGDLFLPISRFWQARLVGMSCPAGKVRVHHVGIDCEQFAYRPRKLEAGQPMILVSIARLVEKKGIEYAIRALAQVVRNRPNIHYRIIGDGPLQSSLERLVTDLRLESHVAFTGIKTSDQVADELSRAHVMLAPSVTSLSGDMEGIPTVLMEAMATGMPVISTRHSGIPELVEDGVSGRLVAERDVDGLADAIQALMRDTGAWIPMGVAAREKVSREFSSAELNARLEDYFDSLSQIDPDGETA